MGIESLIGPNFLTTKLDYLVKWARRGSLWPMTFGTACCAIEMASAFAARFDIGRFGAEFMRFSPRQSDVLIVSGRIANKMVPVLRRIYEQMAEPKWVISMGACASSGGVFNNYAIIQGIDAFLPVDVYMPGCPPRPESMLRALMQIQERVKQDGGIWYKGESLNEVDG